jgi:hypothetical protein
MRRITKGRIIAAAFSLAVMTTLTGATVAGAAGARTGTRSVYVPSSPVRVLDTRDGRGIAGGIVGKVAADGEIVVDFAAALGDLPADTTALTFNLTSVDSEGAGFATVWPDGESMPNVSNLNKVGAGPVANLATVKVGPTGRLRLHNTGGRSHYIMDFSGHYATISTTSAVVSQKGDTGPAGPAGAKGDTGSTGAAGLNGATGATGATGAAGPNGVAGPNGAAGAAGPTGPQGSTGTGGRHTLTPSQAASSAWDKDAYRSFTHVVPGHRFTALAFDGTNMWALDQDNTQAVVLDGISGEVIDTITLPNTPLAVVSDGASVWISLKDPALVQFTAATRVMEGTYPMDVRGDVLAVTPMADSARVWAADRTSSKVQAFDNAGALSYTVEIVGAAQGLAVGSNGLIWAAGKDFLQAIDINSGILDRTSDPVGWEIGAVAYDGEYFYVTQLSGSSVVQIEESTGKIGWAKNWCSGSGSIPIVFDGRYLYELCTSDTLLIRIDTALDVFSDVTIPVAFRPQAAAFDGHNLWIVMPDDEVVKRMRPSFN